MVDYVQTLLFAEPAEAPAPPPGPKAQAKIASAEPLEDPLGACLSERFGFAAFRPGQREAIEGALAGRDVLVLLPRVVLAHLGEGARGRTPGGAAQSGGESMAGKSDVCPA